MFSCYCYGPGFCVLYVCAVSQKEKIRFSLFFTVNIFQVYFHYLSVSKDDSNYNYEIEVFLEVTLVCSLNS